MDQKQPPVVHEPFTYPSSAEIERLMQRGRSLRAAAMADLARAMTGAVRRAFRRTKAGATASAGNWRPQPR
jgi:hypothetical protein